MTLKQCKCIAAYSLSIGTIFSNFTKTMIMAFGPITPWQVDGETVETVADYFWGL